jgi:hypothetical protein
MAAAGTRLATLSVVTCAILGSSLGGAAGAAVVSGSNFVAIPTAGTCYTELPSLSCTLTIASLPPGNTATGGTHAAIDGVVVSWRVKAGAVSWNSTIALRVVHGTEGGGRGSAETLPAAGGTYEYQARMPVRAGDAIGLDVINALKFKTAPITREAPFLAASFNAWVPPLGEGETRAPDGVMPETELLMNATIEPDADGDGWGDESQDECLGSAGQANGCGGAGGGGGPPPAIGPPAPSPETTINGGPKGKLAVAKATFRFGSPTAGSSFQCKLDKKPWKTCKSPKVYRGLKEGPHAFKVRAVSPGGLVDSSPAKRSFKVELQG